MAEQLGRDLADACASIRGTYLEAQTMDTPVGTTSQICRLNNGDEISRRVTETGRARYRLHVQGRTPEDGGQPPIIDLVGSSAEPGRAVVHPYDTFFAVGLDRGEASLEPVRDVSLLPAVPPLGGAVSMRRPLPRDLQFGFACQALGGQYAVDEDMRREDCAVPGGVRLQRHFEGGQVDIDRTPDQAVPHRPPVGLSGVLDEDEEGPVRIERDPDRRLPFVAVALKNILMTFGTSGGM